MKIFSVRSAAAWFVVSTLAMTAPRPAPAIERLTALEHSVLGNLYYSTQDDQLAVQQYRMALKQDRHYVPALLALGKLAYERKDWKEARSYFLRILDKTPNDAAAINNLATVDLAEGKPLDRAVEQIENVLPSAGPLAPYLLDTLGNIAIRQGRFNDARKIFAQAAEVAPRADAAFDLQLKTSRNKLAQALGLPPEK